MGLFSSLFGSSSASTTSNTTYSADTRDQSVNNAGDGILLNGSGSLNITNTLSDGGAINASVELFQTGVGFAKGVSDSALASNTKSSETAINAVKSASAGAVDAVKEAYSTAKAGEQRVMAMAALALVAVVAFKSVKS